MFKFNHNRLATFALLMFISQSVLASVIDCVVGLDAEPSIQAEYQLNTDHNQHSSHHSDASMTQHTADMSKSHNMNDMQDCCAAGTHCSMPTCLFIVLPGVLNIQMSAQSYRIDISYYQSIPKNPVSSLYRPPILA